MKSISKILLLLCLNALAIGISGETLLLDLATLTPEWLTYDCHYSLDYIDNWSFGCAKTEPEQDIYPAYQGFWTQCKPVACHFLVDGEYLRISNITIKSYFHGESQIIVSGKETINSTDSTEIITISDGSKTWLDKIVPLIDHPEVKIFDITLTAPEVDGYILVDHIFFEYEELEKPPTTTTTPRPPWTWPTLPTWPTWPTLPTRTPTMPTTTPPATNTAGPTTTPPATNTADPTTTPPATNTAGPTTTPPTTTTPSSAPTTVATQLFCLLSGLMMLLTVS